jgi:hypothetical protein
MFRRAVAAVSEEGNAGMPKVKRVSHETPAVRVVEVETVDAGGGLHLFRSVSRIHDVGEDGSRFVASETVRQGVVDGRNLAKLLANREFSAYQPYKVPREVGRLVPMLATAELLEIARREGNPVITSKIYDRVTKSGLLHTTDKSNLVQSLGEEMDFENIIFFAVHDYSLVDVRGRPVPRALKFDYMEGGLANDRFDLEKVAEVLAENPEVEIVTDRRGGNSAISEIPYYNAHDGRDQQIQLVWRPSDESWDSMLGMLGFDPKQPEHLRIKPETVISDVDFFGIQQFRVQESDEFEGLGDTAHGMK